MEQSESGPTNEPYFIEHSFTKDKYRLIQEKEEHSPAAKNEIYITNDGRPNKFYAYGAEYLLQNPDKDLRLKATGKAISKAFLVAELIRKRIKGIHQQTTVDTTDSISKYEPLEEGLDVVSITKKLSVVEILLSYNALDLNHYGYQAPLEEDQVNPITYDELIKNKQPKKRWNPEGKFEGDEKYEEKHGFRGGHGRGGYEREGRGGRRRGGRFSRGNRRPRSLSESRYERKEQGFDRGGL